MQEHLEISAVIGFSGTLFNTQETYTMDCFYTLIINTSSIL
jgi:hypothetical protein